MARTRRHRAGRRRSRRAGRRRSRRAGTRKSRRRGGRAVPWKGWGKIAPQGHARTVMLRKCGRKCFLGPRKSFPVCAKGTCKINKKGLYAAYIRARQWGKKRSSYKGRSRPRHAQRVYRRVARSARAMLRSRGALRGGRKYRRSRTAGRRSRRSRTGGRRRLRKCRKGTRHRLIGQRRGRRGRISRHGRLCRKCTRRRRRRRRRRRGGYSRRSLSPCRYPVCKPGLN